MADDMSNCPAYMTFTITVQYGIDAEAMLFSALNAIVKVIDFADLDNQAKARCAQHLADKFKSETAT